MYTELMVGYVGNVEKLASENTDFRRVLFTGQHEQLVLMHLLPNEDIGEEVHAIVDQFLRVEAGEGKVIIDGEEKAVSDGDSIIVPAGAKHNLINTSSKNPLKLYTIYAPPHHKHGTIHKTREDAEADTKDYI